MPIDNLDIIDFVSLNKYGNVELTISDHLEWDTNNEHLLLLQKKINAYLNAIESGDLYKSYPKAKDKNITINLVTKYWPSADGLLFLERLKEYLQPNGYEFCFEKLVENRH